MLDKFWEIIIQIWEYLLPFEVIQPYNKGVMVRLGKIHSDLSNGFYFKIPLADIIHTAFMGDDTILTPTHPLTTKDLKSVSISAIILYKVTDQRMYLTKVSKPQQSISDAVSGVISEFVLKNNYEDLITEKLSDKITKRSQKECDEWGVTIEYVRFASISNSKSLNLLMDTKAHL